MLVKSRTLGLLSTVVDSLGDDLSLSSRVVACYAGISTAEHLALVLGESTWGRWFVDRDSGRRQGAPAVDWARIDDTTILDALVDVLSRGWWLRTYLGRRAGLIAQAGLAHAQVNAWSLNRPRSGLGKLSILPPA